MDQGNSLPLSAENIIQLLKSEFSLTFNKKGQDYFAFCPFHQEKSSSFAFEPEKKIFKCFGCDLGFGNIFKLWAQIKKVPLAKARQEIKQLGYQVGSEESLLKWEEGKQEKNLLSLVAKIYQHNLYSLTGKKIYTYLKQRRQLDYPTIQQFGLGCSVSHQQLTNLFLSSEEAKQLLLVNLLKIKENNKIGDFFVESQLIIPLQNEEGEIIAFAARQTEDLQWNSSKYNLLPNYENYQKSRLIYNYFRVKQASEDFCYLVEGFFDVISLAQKGINNCLASLGTMISKQQIGLLKKLKKKIVLFLDGDSAGKQATIKIALILLAHDIECEVITHSLSLDPDEICLQKKRELAQILQKKEDPYLFILQHFSQAWEIRENPQSISNFIRKIASLFKNFPVKVQEFLVEKISLLTHWSQAEIKEVYFAAREKTATETSHDLTEINLGEKEKYLLAYCCQNRRYWLMIKQTNYVFFQPENRYLYRCLHNYYTTEPYLEAELDKLTFSNSNKIELQEIINEIDPNSMDDFLKLLQER